MAWSYVLWHLSDSIKRGTILHSLLTLGALCIFIYVISPCLIHETTVGLIKHQPLNRLHTAWQQNLKLQLLALHCILNQFNPIPVLSNYFYKIIFAVIALLFIQSFCSTKFSICFFFLIVATFLTCYNYHYTAKLSVQ